MAQDLIPAPSLRMCNSFCLLTSLLIILRVINGFFDLCMTRWTSFSTRKRQPGRLCSSSTLSSTINCAQLIPFHQLCCLALQSRCNVIVTRLQDVTHYTHTKMCCQPFSALHPQLGPTTTNCTRWIHISSVRLHPNVAWPWSTPSSLDGRLDLRSNSWIQEDGYSYGAPRKPSKKPVSYGNYSSTPMPRRRGVFCFFQGRTLPFIS